MKWFKLVLLAIILIILEVSFLPFFRIFGVLPDLILILSIFLLVFKSFPEAIFFAFAGSIFSDFFAASSQFGFRGLGIIFALLIIQFLIGFFRERNFLLLGISVGFATIFYSLFLALAAFLIRLLRETDLSDLSYLLPETLAAKLFYNLIIISPILFLIFKYGRNILRKKNF